jgi:hypothetical protein
MPHSIRRAGPLALLALLLAFPASAQLEANLGGLAEQNAEGYLSPLPSALSGTMNSAIFRSGYVPREGFTFSVGVEAMAIGFDDADRTFVPSDPTGFSSTENVPVPTVIGNTTAVAVHGQAGTVLYYPGGFDLEYFGVAVPQVTIGSLFGTRAVLRYISVDLGDTDLGDFKLFGIGAQHSISQYFPEIPFDLAAGFFHQSMSIGDILDTKAFNLNATASRRYGVLEPYIGLGYDSFKMDAEYTYEAEGGDEKISVDFDRDSHIHLTFGLGLRVTGFGLNLEYNIAAENGVALGINFGN